MDEIVVTGSRIRRDPLTQEAPITFVDNDDIAKTGLNSINDVLQRLPSSGGGLNSKFNNSGNLGNPPDGGGVGAGAAEIDLRYLSSRRTLVLVDGLRFVNGASASGVPGSTDLNAIPESAIERIEVLQDGASAIYGSDAIAGVVNIITKQRQAGFVASAQVGGYLKEEDGWSQNYQLSWGNGGDGPFKIVVGGNYVKQEPVLTADRALSRFPEPYFTTCIATCSGFTPSGRFQIATNPALPINAVTNPVRDLTLIGPVIGRASTPADFRNFVSPADRFNFGPYNFLQIPLERYGLFTNVRYEMTESMNFSAKLLWNERKSKNQAAPLPFGIGPARVRAWAGKPEFTSPPSRLGAYPIPNAPHDPQEIVVLGYHCVGQSPATGNAGGSSCHTLFGFRRGKLTSFQTDSRLFSFASGVHPGMTLREARRREPTATSDPGNVGCTRLRVRSPKGTARTIYYADWPQATRVFSLYVSSGDPAFTTNC